jgi:hypothetical protein
VQEVQRIRKVHRRALDDARTDGGQDFFVEEVFEVCPHAGDAYLFDCKDELTKSLAVIGEKPFSSQHPKGPVRLVIDFPSQPLRAY